MEICKLQDVIKCPLALCSFSCQVKTKRLATESSVTLFSNTAGRGLEKKTAGFSVAQQLKEWTVSQGVWSVRNHAYNTFFQTVLLHMGGCCIRPVNFWNCLQKVSPPWKQLAAKWHMAVLELHVGQADILEVSDRNVFLLTFCRFFYIRTYFQEGKNAKSTVWDCIHLFTYLTTIRNRPTPEQIALAASRRAWYCQIHTCALHQHSNKHILMINTV